MSFSFYLISAIIVSLIYSELNFFIAKYPLLIFQEYGYKTKPFLAWQKENSELKGKMFLLSFSAFTIHILTFIVFIALISENAVYSVLSAFLIILIFIKSEENKKTKLSLKFTKRVIRLTATYIIVSFVFNLLILISAYALLKAIGLEKINSISFCVLSFSPLYLSRLWTFSNRVNLPLEKKINAYYVKKAKAKISGLSSKKIAITGSYGKTSVKNILATVLKEKYSVVATEKSYNTPLGVAKTINNMKDCPDYFIAEMGAKNIGDIKELCDIVCPEIGVLTGINCQHLETFKTIDNIVKTKNELFLNLYKERKAFFSSSNGYSVNLYGKYNGEKYLSGKDYGLAVAKDIKFLGDCYEFTLKIENSEVKVKTSLLGEHNIDNICLASAVAFIEGLTIEEIRSGIEKILPIPHRLCPIKNEYGGIILDDSYNSSPDGVKVALETLKSFKGQKIVITGGLIELGESEKKENFILGQLLSASCDKVIIVGKHNREDILNGLNSQNFKCSNIIIKDTLESAVLSLSGVKAGEVCLFLNDLPDNYS